MEANQKPVNVPNENRDFTGRSLTYVGDGKPSQFPGGVITEGAGCACNLSGWHESQLGISDKKRRGGSTFGCVLERGTDAITLFPLHRFEDFAKFPESGRFDEKFTGDSVRM